MRLSYLLGRSYIWKKKKALDMALHQIERQFGKGSVMKLGENTTSQFQQCPQAV